jgi:hypothetical protein
VASVDKREVQLVKVVCRERGETSGQSGAMHGDDFSDIERGHVGNPWLAILASWLVRP